MFFLCVLFMMCMMLLWIQPIPPRTGLISVFPSPLHRFFSPVMAFHTVYLVAIIALLFSGLSFVGFWFLAAAKSSFWFALLALTSSLSCLTKVSLHNNQSQYIISQHCTFDKQEKEKSNLIMIIVHLLFWFTESCSKNAWNMNCEWL